MNSLSAQQKGSFYAIASGLCYGFIGYFGISLMDEGLSVFNMLFWRFLVTTLFMLIMLIPQYRILLKSFKESLKALFYGMILYSSSGILYFISSQSIGTGLSMVVFFIYPAIVMLFNVIFYKAKISKIYYFAFSMILIGMVLLVDTHKFMLDVFGIVLGILSAILYAFYIIASKNLNISPTLSTLMVSLGCMLTCLISALIDSSFYIPSGFNNWVDISSMALICTAFPILFLLEGLKYISSEKASILSVLEPVFVVILGIILLNEKVTGIRIIGIVIILSGALMTLLPNKSKINE